MQRNKLIKNIKFYLLIQAVGIFTMLPFSAVMAASEEIQVYMDEMNRQGEFGLDVHTNYVFTGRSIPDYLGEQAPNHVFRLTPEFSYGLSDNFELGVYLLSSRDAYSNLTIDGEKVRVKYLAPKSLQQAYFWGANLEIGYVANRIDPNPWGVEIKGIYGYRTGQWTLAVNPSVFSAYSGSIPAPATLAVDTKISYQFERGYALGLESYNGLGSINGLIHSYQQNQALYAVVDTSFWGYFVNFGVGRGATPASDKWGMKAVVNVPLSKK